MTEYLANWYINTPFLKISIPILNWCQQNIYENIDSQGMLEDDISNVIVSTPTAGGLAPSAELLWHVQNCDFIGSS